MKAKMKLVGFLPFGALVALLSGAACSSIGPSDGEEHVLATAAQAIATVPQNLCEFTLYSRERTNLRDRSVSTTGFVGSANGVELGADARVTGHVRATGNVLMRDRSRVEGNLTAGGTFTPGSQTIVTGTISPGTPVPAITIPTKTVTPGTTDVNVFSGTRTLSPGNYRDVHAFSGSTLNLRTGVYNLRSFILEASSVRINLDITSGPIDINVQSEIRFGNGMQMQLIGGTNPRQVRYYTNWPNQLSIGTDLTLFGVVTAPNANIVAFSRAHVRGSLFGRLVTMDTDDTIRGACECGNGFLDPNEQCDDGNTNPNDACTAQCTIAFCGDGVVRTGVEECDDGNTNDLDSCTTPSASQPGCVFRPLRKNVALIPQAERTALISAMRELDNRTYAQDGVSYWDKQDQIHESTHIHSGPQFLPWHRELLNRFERLLRDIDPSVALHYWDWTTDPQVADIATGRVSLFGPNDPTLPPLTFGLGRGPTGEEVRADYPFDIMDANFAGPPLSRPGFATALSDFLLPVSVISRQVGCTGVGFSSDVVAVTPSGGVTTQGQEWPDFSSRLNGEHGSAHGCMGGSIGPIHRAFEDPFVYILHSNVDRLFALWQTVPSKAYRLDPAQVYGDDATPLSTTLEELEEELEPWNGNPTESCPSYLPIPCPMDPWNPSDPNNEVEVKTCFDPSVVRPPRYDTNGAIP